MKTTRSCSPAGSRREGHMRAALSSIALISAVALTLAGVTPANADVGDSLSTYIVDAPTPAALQAAVGPLPDVRSDVLPEIGNAIVELTTAEARTLDARAGVTVVKDAFLSTLDTQNDAPWHLDRLDQKTTTRPADPEGHQYWHPKTAGAGVRIYVVDSGVWSGHPDLAGRVAPGYDAIADAQGATADCNGHGTAVASAAAGTKYGVAKRATIVPVRTADCSGQASVSAVIRGLDWIARTNPAGTPAVINISLGALDKYSNPALSTLESAVAATIGKGFFTAIAAGNDGTAGAVPEACQTSPARTPAAFTVGASDIRTTASEGRAEFSNGGSCVDAFAPGVQIRTASATGADTARNGTSFSAPIVAGLAALRLGANPVSSPAQTTSVLLATAQKGALSTTALNSTIHFSGSVASARASTSPNLLVQTPAQTPDRSSVIGGLRNSARTPTSLTFSWSPTSHPAYLIFRSSSMSSPKKVTVAGSSYTFTGLTAGASYTVAAQTLTDGLLGTAAVSASATTGAPFPALPSAALNLTAATVASSGSTGQRAQLKWSAPAVLGASATTDYVLQYSRNGGAWTTYADGVNVARVWTTPALTASSKYAFRVFVRNLDGTGPGAYTSLSVGRSTPGAVQGLSRALVPATATSTARVKLAWAAPADAGFTPITDYIIQSSKNGGAWTTYSDGKSTVRSFTTPPLTAGAKYAFRVLTVNSWGTGPAATLTPTTTRDRPTAVRNLSTTTGSLTARLAWAVPADPGFTQVTDYIIQRSKNGGAWTTYPDGKRTALGYLTPALDRGTAYAFRVFAVNSAGTGPGTVVEFRTP